MAEETHRTRRYQSGFRCDPKTHPGSPADLASAADCPAGLAEFASTPGVALTATARASEFQTHLAIAEEFESDTLAAFLNRFQENLPELAWTGREEQPNQIRITAEAQGNPICPGAKTVERTEITLGRSYSSGFNLAARITAGSALEAERTFNLLNLRLELILRSRYARSWVPLPGAPMTRTLPTEYPRVFHLNFRMETPPSGLPADMAARMNWAKPGAPWKAIECGGARDAVFLKTSDLHGFQLIYILPQPEPNRIRILLDVTAADQERLESFRQYMIRDIQRALLDLTRRG